ncbi:MAG TPA: esterase [Polyangia bacterium]
MNAVALPLEVRRARSRSRAAVALAALVGPALPACRRHGSSTELAGSGGDLSLGADAPAAIEASGVWGGLRVRTLGERTRPRQVVVLFHGWGAPGTDLVPLGQVLAQPGRLFVFPEGPLVSPGGGRAWWHIDMARLLAARDAGNERALRREAPVGLAEARAQVAALLAEVGRRTGVPAAGLVIGGFSQGAMLATDAILTSPGTAGALVVLSGSIVAEETWRDGLRPRPEGASAPPPAPVFMSHGKGDPVLPFQIADDLHGLLRAAHHEVTWVPFSGGHEIPAPVLSQLQSFLSRVSP